MKDFDVKSKEWREVVEEYFSKELEKNLVQHIIDEKMHKYKLEVYQKTFPDFVCGSLTNTQTSSQNEENEIGPNGTAQEEEV
jgi:UDP-2,3-diacylglucosamine pyrophosphatase LpxH